LTRALYVPVLLSVIVTPAAAQDALRNFPLGRSFKVVSISGFDVQKVNMTFAVAPEPQTNRLVGSGHAGCNNWTATVVLREDQIDITNIATTRKFCGKPRMTSEEAFVTSLKSAQRWRIDDKNRLILEGEAARLLLTASGADKKSGKKSDKKSNQRPTDKSSSR
jgi:heat shock protein HslJ